MPNSHEALKKLESDFKNFQKGIIGIVDLKKIVWKTAQSLTNIDQNDLRDFLMKMEAHLDIIQFTSEDVFTESLAIISNIADSNGFCGCSEKSRRDDI